MSCFTDLYYSSIGYCATPEQYKKTDNFFNYLEEAGVDKNDIGKFIDTISWSKELDNSFITDDLYNEDSILKKEKMYFHKQLIIYPPKPQINSNLKIISFPYYREPKINYSIKDIINYYYSNFRSFFTELDDKKDTGAVNYLLARYKVDFCEPIDFMLYLIDYVKNHNFKSSSILDLSNYDKDAYEWIKGIITNVKFSNGNKYVWR